MGGLKRDCMLKAEEGLQCHLLSAARRNIPRFSLKR